MPVLFATSRRLCERDALPLGEPSQCRKSSRQRLGFSRIHVIALHHKVDDVAARLAAEAVKEATVEIDLKRPLAFTMERTERRALWPRSLQLYAIVFEHRRKVGVLAHELDIDTFGWHGSPPLHEVFLK